MGEYQYRKYNKYVLPTAVYHQCLWISRDIERMENKIASLNDELLISNFNIITGMSIKENLEIFDDRKREIKMLEEKVEGFYRALEMVPEEYREVLLNNIINHIKYSDYAHENT